MNPKNNLLKKVAKIATRLLPSTTYSKLIFRKYYGYRFNLFEPRTFNEKLWWIHIFNRDDLTTRCTDKFLVREYIESCGLGHILNEIYAVYDSPSEIDLSTLPKEFFLKCNHLSDGNIWCKDKEKFDLMKTQKKLSKLLKKNYYWSSREWNYKNITPKIICEKVLRDEKPSWVNRL